MADEVGQQEYDRWLAWMNPAGFMVRGLSKEDAARLLAQNGFTVTEYERRLKAAYGDRPFYGGSPRSALVFIKDATVEFGFRVQWAV